MTDFAVVAVIYLYSIGIYTRVRRVREVLVNNVTSAVHGHPPADCRRVDD